MKHWFPDFPRRPHDTDQAVHDKKLAHITDQTEFHYNPILSHLSDYGEHLIATPNQLLTLKVSHIFWDIKWDKHMFDIQFLLKKGATLRYRLFKELFDFWESYHGPRKTSDLKLSKEAFFDNQLKTYDHDLLHSMLCPIPTYVSILKEGSEVEPDEEKFKLLSHDKKADLVREEVMVMAYERLDGRDYRVAYNWMLKKFIMHHAPIWEALWIIENYIELHKPKINYKKQLDYAIANYPGNTPNSSN